MIFLFIPTAVPPVDGKVEIKCLLRQYLRAGRSPRRLLRAVPMTFFYLVALLIVIYLLGGYPRPPIRGLFPFESLIGVVACLFAFLTFLVIDAIALHAGFLGQLNQLSDEERTHWPPETVAKFRYSLKPDGPLDESDLSDYWNILFIARRTEAIGNLIYYPFIVLTLLIVSRLSYFANWTWSPGFIVALCIHFFLALFAAWLLPKVAQEYREKVLQRMEQRKLQNLNDQKTFDAIDAVMQDVRSTHQGAFAYLGNNQQSGRSCYRSVDLALLLYRNISNIKRKRKKLTFFLKLDASVPLVVNRPWPLTMHGWRKTVACQKQISGCTSILMWEYSARAASVSKRLLVVIVLAVFSEYNVPVLHLLLARCCRVVGPVTGRSHVGIPKDKYFQGPV